MYLAPVYSMFKEINTVVMIIALEPMKLQKVIIGNMKYCGSFVIIVNNHDFWSIYEYNRYTK